MASGEGVLGRLGVQPAERALLGWAVACLLLLGASSFALLNAAETLFLKRVGVDFVPLALLASAGLLVVTTASIGRVASDDPPGWLWRILAGLALALLPFIVLADSQEPLVLGALLLVSRQVLALGALAFWLAMGSLVPARRAKQIFAPLAAGVTTGGIAGSFGSEPLARWLGMDGLIALCAATLLAGAGCALLLRRSGTRSLDRPLGGRAPAQRPVETGLFALLRDRRLFRLLSVPLFCGGLLSPVLYFEFASVLDASTQGPNGEQRMLDLYGQFRGWMNLAMLVTQLWLSSFLYRHIGLPLSLALWPAAYVLGFAWLGIDFALYAALTTWGLAQVSEDGVSDSAARVLYNLFPDGVRSYATGLLEGPINRLGGLVGNALLMGALALGGASWIGWGALLVGVPWLLSGLVLWRGYPGLLLQASAEHGLAGAGVDRATLLDAATLRSLAVQLVAPDAARCRAAIDLLVDGETRLVVRLLAEAVDEAPAENRPLIVEALHRLVAPLPGSAARSDEALQALERALATGGRDLPASERADLLQVYARLSSDPELPAAQARASLALLDRALGDRAAPVRLAATSELHRRGAPPPGLPDLDRTLADALGASDALLRRAARKELRASLLVTDPDDVWQQRLQVLAGHLQQRSDRAETAEALLEVARRHGPAAREVVDAALLCLEDRDPRVRGALLALAGRAERVDEAPRLVEALGARTPEEVAGAREGLAALGASAVLPLLVGLETGGPGRRPAILSLLGELEVEPAKLVELHARQLTAVQHAILERAAVDEQPGEVAPLLRRRLDERIAEGTGSLLGLLAALNDEPRLVELEQRLRRAPEGQSRDLLVEAIEALLGRADREVMVALLEGGSVEARSGWAARALGVSVPSSADALEGLRESADPTVRALAVHSLVVGETIGDPRPVPSTIAIAAHLQGTSAFDRLTTPQLMALAAVVQEQRLAEGERLYGVGDEGMGLYFVVEGALELRRGDLVIDRVEPGGFCGELSTLDGVPRSVDAIAPVASRVLRLDREDLMPLLDGAPGLAIALAEALASRVRALVDRLEEASAPQGEPS